MEKTYPLWRKVICGICRRAMLLGGTVVKGVDYRYFFCSHAREQVGEGGCSRKYTKNRKLNAVVWEAVKALLAAGGNLKKKIVKKQAEKERFANMDQFMGGNPDQETYQSRRAELSEEAAGLEEKISDLEAKLQEMETIRDDGTKEALEMMERFKGVTELDQKIVYALIDKVLVYDPEHVEIRWKFSDEVIKMMEEFK